VDALVRRWTSKLTKQEIADLLANTGIPTAPVVTLTELMQDEHVAERGVLRRMKDERGDWLTLGSPLFLSDSPIVEPTRAPRLGADTDDILRSELGMSESRDRRPSFGGHHLIARLTLQRADPCDLAE
jgi:crotonobetainyl-CoA:carnitine CoA-transferase CaiB-like acyl-CoA transferase